MKNFESKFKGMNIYEFDAIGTSWYIETGQPLTALVKTCLHDRIDHFDKTYSRFRSDSLVSTITCSATGGTFLFPSDSSPLFALYDQLYGMTDGKVDPLIGAELELLGYDLEYSFQADPQAGYFNPDKPFADWSKDIIRQGTAVIATRPLTIDVGAAGKGYLVDLLAEILIEHGITTYLIDGSGDIRHAGDTEIIIGLEHPENKEMVIGTLPLKNNAICASATNRRRWGNGLHHILNGRTGKPAEEVIATWAIADNALLADGLATALFFVGADRLSTQFDFSSVRVFSDLHVEVSKNFTGTLFTA